MCAWSKVFLHSAGPFGPQAPQHPAALTSPAIQPSDDPAIHEPRLLQGDAILCPPWAIQTRLSGRALRPAVIPSPRSFYVPGLRYASSPGRPSGYRSILGAAGEWLAADGQICTMNPSRPRTRRYASALESASAICPPPAMAPKSPTPRCKHETTPALSPTKASKSRAPICAWSPRWAGDRGRPSLRREVYLPPVLARLAVCLCVLFPQEQLVAEPSP